MDWFDVMVLTGFLLLGAAVGLGFGPVVAMAYAGVILIGIGIAGAMNARRTAGDS